MQNDDFIFISHAEEDEEFAVQIADGLEKEGYRTWYYERNSIPGISYLEQISKTLRYSQAVILLISPNSLNSFHVTKEVESAYEMKKPFIPILGVLRFFS